MAFADVMLGGGVFTLVYILMGRPYFNLWSFKASLELLFFICDTIFSQASLISAVFISCERFFAVVWPLRQKTLSTRAHRIAVFMVWTLAIIDDRADLPTLKKTRLVYLGVVSINLSSDSFLLQHRHLEEVSKSTRRFTNGANQCQKKTNV